MFRTGWNSPGDSKSPGEFQPVRNMSHKKKWIKQASYFPINYSSKTYLRPPVIPSIWWKNGFFSGNTIFINGRSRFIGPV